MVGKGGALGAAAFAGYEGGKILDEKFGLHEKVADAAFNALHDKDGKPTEIGKKVDSAVLAVDEFFTKIKDKFKDEGTAAVAISAAKAAGDFVVTPAGKGEDAANRKNQAMMSFLGNGYSKADAADITTNFLQESGMSPNAVGDGGKAYGIGQWHPDRQKNYEKLNGHTMQSVTNQQQALQEQLVFADWELKNTEAKSWKKGHEDKLAGKISGSIYSRKIERPAATEAEAQKRGVVANQLEKDFASVNVTQHIYGSSDSKETAKMATDRLAEAAKTNPRYQTTVYK
jgi:hypothetical protein